METNAGLVAGSHNRNELQKPLNNLNGLICQICGDVIGLREEGNAFVACNECAFPVCRPCYEYERREGNKCCPSAKVDTRGTKDDVDDLESEFDHAKTDCKTTQMWSPQGREEAVDLSSSSRHEPYHCIMRLTSRQQVSGEIPEATSDNHSLRSQSGPLGSSEKRSSTYVDPRTCQERVEGWKLKQDKSIIHASSKYADGKGDMEGTGSNGEELQMADDSRQPLSRIVPIPSNQLNLYRLVIICRLIILCFFFQYRVTHPVNNAYPLWLTSVICEVWFALSWLLDQFPKWSPINRETYLDRLALRYDREGEPSIGSN
ncbi:hypothetical protein HPP92_027351 [Vanilla planifolia]|uniref:Cellulose synthase RING-type zinc finger domain-containing protein n=1 Tax=Vanilla planifolia TaxID=51239 RepID=A0A835PBD4_VANPL|nr:hypothetical protein HPP92_027351 [Vanilla planifolia]